MKVEKINLSIIITLNNRDYYLDKTLDYLSVQTCNNFEVVVIDDGSTDKIKEVIEKYKNIINIKYLYYNRTIDIFRVSYLRNQGMINSDGKYVTFLDCGMIMSKFFVEKTIKHMNEDNFSKVLLHYIYGFMISESDLLATFLKQITKNSIEENISLLKGNFLFLDYRDNNFRKMNKNINEYIAPWVLGWSGALTIDKESLEKVSGFNENITGWGSEDTELCYRLFRMCNSMFSVTHDAFVIHIPHPTSSNVEKDESNFKNRKSIVSLKEEDKIILELYPYFDGQYYNEFLFKLQNLNIWNYNSIYSEIIFENIREYIRINSLDKIALWGGDSTLGLTLGAKKVFNLELLKRQEMDNRIDYINSFGIDTGISYNEFDLIIVTDMIFFFPYKIVKEIVKEIQKISKQIILINDTDFQISNNPVKNHFLNVNSSLNLFDEYEEIYKSKNQRVLRR